MIEKRKILLLMCHWIGDTFWAMQVIPELRNRYPDAEIWAGIKPWSKDLLYNLIDENKILVLKNVISDRHREKFSLPSYIRELTAARKESFDIVIDLTCNRYSALFAYLARARQRVGLSLHKLNFLYNHRGPSFSATRHLYERPWETLRILFPDIEIPKKLFPPFVNGGQCAVIADSSQKIALLVPGAGWKEKEWEIDNFAACGKFLIGKGFQVIIAGSEKERPICVELKNRLGNTTSVFIHPLRDFIDLIPQISIAITNDSGPAHLIAAFDAKLITVFKKNNYEQYRPIGKNVKVLRPNEATVAKAIDVITTIIS